MTVSTAATSIQSIPTHTLFRLQVLPRLNGGLHPPGLLYCGWQLCGLPVLLLRCQSPAVCLAKPQLFHPILCQEERMEFQVQCVWLWKEGQGRDRNAFPFLPSSWEGGREDSPVYLWVRECAYHSHECFNSTCVFSRCVSTIHAVIVGLFCLYILWFDDAVNANPIW